MTAGHWFEDAAAFLGPAYLRYSFTKGTEQEVAFLVEALTLVPGQRVLDVGCGPGRHAHALARRGLEVVGVDISEKFVALASASAPPGARFVVGDARSLAYAGEFDAVISLCQGGFGLVGRTEDGAADAEVVRGMAAALSPGGRLALSAFSSYFLVRHLEDHDTFDAETGVNHERTELRDESGARREMDLWTTCFTPRELRQMVRSAGLIDEAVWSVSPGDYARRRPDLDHPEFLIVARSPAAG